jgi:hypothetical protein
MARARARGEDWQWRFGSPGHDPSGPDEVLDVLDFAERRQDGGASILGLGEPTGSEGLRGRVDGLRHHERGFPDQQLQRLGCSASGGSDVMPSAYWPC